MRIASIVGAGFLVASCSSTSYSAFTAHRTVFFNPYDRLEVENGPVGPDCAEEVLPDSECFKGDVVYRIGRKLARTSDGSIVRLSREQREELRLREEAIRSRIDILESLENETPLPPGSPALPDRTLD